MAVDVRIVDHEGAFLHSCVLPEAPTDSQLVRLYDKTYRIYSVTWVPVRTFPYQKPGVEVSVREIDEPQK